MPGRRALAHLPPPESKMSKPPPQAYDQRRRHPRAKILINVDWGETPACAYEGQVTSLSVGGCFVLTPRRATKDKTIFIRLLLAPESKSILEGVVQGRVAYQLADVGFGVEFKSLPGDYKQHIQDIVDFHLEHDEGSA